MKKAKSFKDYISELSPEIQVRMKTIRQTVKSTIPAAEEVISYGMPAFRYHGMLVFYAAFKKHYSFFFGAQVTKDFAAQLSAYETSKGTIRIPNEKPVPVQLLKKLTKYAAKKNEEKAKQKLILKISGVRKKTVK